MKHRAGFVNIIGLPNAGKSTLLNALMGDKTAIVTPKPQTTRHRLKAMINGEDYQVIFSDTPGFIHAPAYLMQENMNSTVSQAFEDADLLLFVVSPEDPSPDKHPMTEMMTQLAANQRLVLILNKSDQISSEEAEDRLQEWRQLLQPQDSFAVSALKSEGVDSLFKSIVEHLPLHPPFYDKEDWTDRSERFFTSEFIREQILLLFHQEIPYNVEVQVESFKRGTSKKGPIIRIIANVYVSRRSQKAIMIGKDGKMIRKLGTASRKSLESFFGENVFLQIFIKARKGWRNDKRWLKNFGYE
ncbi:MAG TPA: GTPase Era [Saprospiraceae bacterium]|nr:GTPase Era [Saprospiraceae bacterium]